MSDRILSGFLVTGAFALAIFLFQRQYAAPACQADTVTAQATRQVSAAMGHIGIDVANIRDISGGLFSRVRQCRMDVAPLIGLQAFDSAQWKRVLYSDSRGGKTNTVTVVAHIAGPAEVHLTGQG